MNKRTERIITIGLAVGLIAYFCYQVAYGVKETCSGLLDGGKCLMDNIPYQYGFYDGKNAGLIAFYQIDDDCDSTIPAHMDQCIKGYTDGGSE
jgi:hypothetical protein